MQAVVFKEPFKVAVEQRPIPTVQDPEDIVVKVGYTACVVGKYFGTIIAGDERQLLMCENSDLHVYRGIEPSPPGPIMGHEFMGEIVEVGSAVMNLQKGDRVVSAFTTSWYVYLAVPRQWNSNFCGQLGKF